jgi:hypothetical protein
MLVAFLGRLPSRLITSAALILFLAFIAPSRGPTSDVKILATALALGIIIDATIVRGILAPALVAALGPANWWTPRRPRNTQNARSREPLGKSPEPAPATQHTAPDHPGEQRPDPGRPPRVPGRPSR